MAPGRQPAYEEFEELSKQFFVDLTGCHVVVIEVEEDVGGGVEGTDPLRNSHAQERAS